MEQFNMYKDGAKVFTTEGTTFDFTDLQSDTECTIGVSRVLNGRESDIVTVKVAPGRDSVEVADGSEDVERYHTGAGWYELPNGEKVRGKDNAIAMLEDLTDE